LNAFNVYTVKQFGQKHFRLEVVESGQAQNVLDPIYTYIWRSPLVNQSIKTHLNTRCKQGLFLFFIFFWLNQLNVKLNLNLLNIKHNTIKNSLSQNMYNYVVSASAIEVQVHY